MDQFLQSLQTERARLISKIRVTVKYWNDGKGDTIGCKDAESIVRMVTVALADHERWIRANEPDA